MNYLVSSFVCVLALVFVKRQGGILMLVYDLYLCLVFVYSSLLIVECARLCLHVCGSGGGVNRKRKTRSGRRGKKKFEGF